MAAAIRLVGKREGDLLSDGEGLGGTGRAGRLGEEDQLDKGVLSNSVHGQAGAVGEVGEPGGKVVAPPSSVAASRSSNFSS